MRSVNFTEDTKHAIGHVLDAAYEIMEAEVRELQVRMAENRAVKAAVCPSKPCPPPCEYEEPGNASEAGRTP